MSDGKQKMQADGAGTHRPAPDDHGEIASRRGGPEQTGESGGGAYPNPHGTEAKGKQGSFMGHGGQSDQAYYGHNQLGDEDLGPTDNSPSTD